MIFINRSYNIFGSFDNLYRTENYSITNYIYISKIISQKGINKLYKEEMLNNILLSMMASERLIFMKELENSKLL